MVIWYWSVAILFWQLSIDHIVNVQCKRCGLGKTRLRHPSLPFDSLPYPTHTICRRVRTYVRSVNHVTTKWKEVDHILLVWALSHARFARVGAPLLWHLLLSFRNKERFLCLARQFIIWVSNKDKRIEKLDIKRRRKKYSKDFLWLNNSKLL